MNWRYGGANSPPPHSKEFEDASQMDFDHRSGRRRGGQCANARTAPEHWQHHFGKGLSSTPSDLGHLGQIPSHPELLDWLASYFVEHHWSTKEMHRLILTSATYRQESSRQIKNGNQLGSSLMGKVNTDDRLLNSDSSKAQAIDADNRYLWRMNRQRLDAEEIRDSVLAVSGKLDLTMGGPGFELFRFKDDHSPVYDHGDLDKISNPATFRRTVYRFVVRSVPNPFLDCLDSADPNLNTPVRNTTLTALQALALLNDPFMVRQSEFFAERLRAAGEDPERQIERAFLLAFSRPPAPAERAEVAAYARKHGLANACRMLLNANEFVFVD